MKLYILLFGLFLLGGCGKDGQGMNSNYPWDGGHDFISEQGIYLRVINPPEYWEYTFPDEAYLGWYVDIIWQQTKTCTKIDKPPGHLIVDFVHKNYMPPTTSTTGGGLIYWEQSYSYSRIWNVEFLRSPWILRHEFIHHLLYLNGVPGGDLYHQSRFFISCT